MPGIFLFYFIFYFLVFFLLFLGPLPRHMEVPRLGVESELQPPAYARARATRDPSRVCNLHHSSRQRRILNPQARPGTEPATSWFLVGFVNHCATTGTPGKNFLKNSASLYSPNFYYVKIYKQFIQFNQKNPTKQQQQQKTKDKKKKKRMLIGDFFQENNLLLSIKIFRVINMNLMQFHYDQ